VKNQNKNMNLQIEKVKTGLDQEAYLRKLTQHFYGIEKPLKNGPIVQTFDQLKEALRQEFESNYVNIERVNHLMMIYQSNPKEWQKFAKFDRFKYTRNLVDEGNGKYDLMILCWGEGQGSAVHDHSDSHCFMKMLKGELKETRYKMPDNRTSDEECELNVDGECMELQEIGSKPMCLNDVAYINDNIGLHRVENPSHSDTAVSLHLYCPPYDTCHVFQSSGKKSKSCVTFWSKYGVRTNPNEK